MSATDFSFSTEQRETYIYSHKVSEYNAVHSDRYESDLVNSVERIVTNQIHI